ncbi:MAG: chemotaxis protein CheW [Thermodesulfovibrionales bacterium]
MNDGTIDWSEIRQRLEAAHTLIGQGFSPGPDEKKRVLMARAALLSKEPKEKEAGEYIEVVEFLLAQEHYCIETHFIREVYPLRDYTPVPCTPSYVLGLINVRGQILSVIDIKKFFDMPEKGLSDLNKVIILRCEEPGLNKAAKMEFGILADAILGVRNISPDDIQPSLPTLTGIREDFLRGVTGERAVILDAGKLLADKNIIVHEEVK